MTSIKSDGQKEEEKKFDYYFDSYAHYGIHESMLKDSHRTESYRDAMIRNPHVFRDKVVLDVGCGTGILSMFAVKAGARKVYAVDCSDIAKQAKSIIKENNMEEFITVIHGKLEDIKLDTKVDIIVSEWMGYFLLYESMMNSVLDARDRFGTKDTIILPNKATLYLSGIEDKEYWERKALDWDDVYGIKMKCMSRKALIEPLVESVRPSQIITSVQPLKTFDLNTVKIPDLSFESEFKLVVRKDHRMHAICGHFDTLFDLHDSVLLTTSPYGILTHWKQTVFYLAEPIAVKCGDVITGTLSCYPNKGNHRDLDIRIKLNAETETEIITLKQDYRLR